MEKTAMGLRGLIYAKFKSANAFAEYIGWTNQKISYYITGKRIPSLKDVWIMADALDVPFMNVAQFFLTEESPDGDN
jgi:transcriptional regulator with XRE-family HTH domain